MPNPPGLHSGVNDLPQRSLHDLGFSELSEALGRGGVIPHHTKALWRALHREGELDLSKQDFSPPLARWVEESVGEGKPFFLDAPTVVDEIRSSDGLTRKFLLRLTDGQTIETVLMGYDGRHTVCVSTQAGCAMGCVFCATGQMGFVRHLRPGEIVAQVLHARRVLKSINPERRVRNIVLMGMGEPLHNYDSVIKALSSISDVRGIGIGPSKIAICTVGVVPNILRLAEEGQPYRLAVSLHGSTEEERSALVPASKRWSLAMLVDACRKYGEITGKRIFFGWTLIAGKNDSPETARRLVELLKGIDAHINLIPLNPTGGFSGTESDSGHEFQKILQAAGFPCTFRQRRGIDVAAGCGMLKAEKRVRQPAPLSTASD
ncbi:23S rRNA (adenine(2503)-C(2))-methyltransferase RlmN [Luteolibacter yonseiensis]|uniref:23S rRNA (Adenine(2503)-C(2))-methyltransferase RlmN n=1 Tax=Luteolibacter yonseiensis TaxID=1144680 RepID=A0A934R5E7_9BACT|nr:23S rRNA (adenine(2503)-C(2))-methyltransferase RlmN [Luteolibacter yonseiensis]MBK1815494.1 23S rRNA (adenine(2503)-C(2))-methyltransferase RlmN [Luteolibacter yonseiensis]